MARLTLLFSVIVLLSCSEKSAKLTFVEKEGRVLLMEGEKPLWKYQLDTLSSNGSYTRNNYLHPVYSFDGSIITEDFPEDHVHHRGIFWTWHQVYKGEERLADPWLCENIKWDIQDIDYRIEKDTALLTLGLVWIAGGVRVISEKVSVRYYDNKVQRNFEFVIQLLALMDSIYIGGSEDVKGYGGFSVRLKNDHGLNFTSQTGREIEPQNTPVNGIGNEVTINGFNGDDQLIIKADTTLENFQGWILRAKGSMQNVAWPGRDRLQIPANRPLSLKYSLILKD